MATLLPADFREFLKLCAEKRLRYLLVGGYAVNYYGYSRTTGDLDIWIDRSRRNAFKMVQVLQAFGFGGPDLTEAWFLEKGSIFRMGVPPLRLEVLNDLSGVTFSRCYAARERTLISDVPVNLINLRDLRRNKKAAGRHKDLNDLEHLLE
jgi:hypothetical protein